MPDKKTKSERIEALIYPNPEFKDESGMVPTTDSMQARIDKIIAEVNQRLLPYQRIERITILDEPMEMTTTKKIKRDAV